MDVTFNIEIYIKLSTACNKTPKNFAICNIGDTNDKKRKRSLTPVTKGCITTFNSVNFKTWEACKTALPLRGCRPFAVQLLFRTVVCQI